MHMENYLNNLKVKGFRITKAREKLLSLFYGTHKTLTFKDIQSHIQSSADRATIYRNLAFLEKVDLLTSFKIGEETYYELADHSHHHHLMCKRCGDIYPIFYEELEDIISQIESKAKLELKFKITEHSIEFFGYCKKCLSKNV